MRWGPVPDRTCGRATPLAGTSGLGSCRSIGETEDRAGHSEAGMTYAPRTRWAEAFTLTNEVVSGSLQSQCAQGAAASTPVEQLSRRDGTPARICPRIRSNGRCLC